MSILSIIFTGLLYASMSILIAIGCILGCFIASFLSSCIRACATFAIAGTWHVVNCLFEPEKSDNSIGGLAKDLGCVYHALDGNTKVEPWAVVTGSTDGIGFEIASRLFQFGWNVMIMGRNQTKIDAAISKIKYQHAKVEKKLSSYCMDFSKATISDYELFSSSFSKLTDGGQLRLLVNNAGLATDIPDFLSSLEDKVVVDIVNVNVTALMMMTKTAIPMMMTKGMIVNMSSAFSLLPCCPLNSVYAATKAFVNSFTKSMQQEYAETGIIFKLLTPHLVVSPMSKFEKPSFFVPSAKSYASYIVCSGFSQVGYFSHELIIFLTSLIPSVMLSSTIMKTMLSHRNAMKLHRIKNQ